MLTRCAFCLSRPPKLSGEHIWDDWISRMYKAKTGRQKYVITEYDASETPVRSFIKTSIDKTLPVVCEQCNNTWMSDIVNIDARPAMKDLIFHTREQTLLSRGLLGLARFMFLKSAVLDAVRQDSDPFYSAPARQQFMSSRTFPPGVQIWIASYGSSQHHGHAWTSYSKPNERPLQGVEFFYCTYAIGLLVMQLACPRWIIRSRRNERLPMVTPSRQWGDVSRDVYPLTAPMSVSWPPRASLDARGLFAFKERFHTLRVSLS